MMSIYQIIMIFLVSFLSVVTRVVCIANCAETTTGWYNLEKGCGDCKDPKCDAGWSVSTYKRCRVWCDQRGCSRQVCSRCNPGYRRDGFTNSHATSCTLCPQFDGCTGIIKCSGYSDSSYCEHSCHQGFYQYVYENTEYDLYWKLLRPFIPDLPRSLTRCNACKNIPNCEPGKTSCTSSSNQKCASCLKGYFLESNSQKCTLCPAGYYCDGKVKKACWDIAANLYGYCQHKGTVLEKISYECPSEAKFGPTCDKDIICVTSSEHGRCTKDKCWSLKGNGNCSECSSNAAGLGCEHRVCLHSKLGQFLNKNYANNPAEFNFSMYVPEDIKVDQIIERSGDFGLQVSYIPVAFDIYQYRLLINGLNTGVLNSARPVCSDSDSMDSERNVMPLFVLNSDVDVGTLYDLCLRGEWEDSRLMLTSGSWMSLAEGYSRPYPQTCLRYTVKFQSSVTFFVRDLFNTVGIEGSTVNFYVESKGVKHRFAAATNRSGRVTVNVLVNSVDEGIDSLNLYIQNVTTTNYMESPVSVPSNFTFCHIIPARGNACPESEQSTLGEVSEIIHHLNLKGRQEFLIVDKSAVQVQGKLLYPGPDPNMNETLSCGIANATVIAIDARSGGTLIETVTDSTGYFSFAIARWTLLKLDIMYHNHSFVAANSLTEILLQEDGYEVEDAIIGLSFRDTTMSKITIISGVSECMFDIGNYELELSVPSCPGVGPYPILSRGRESIFVEIPAHSYTWQLQGFDGFGYGTNSNVDGATIKERFDYMFPATTRQIDLTDSEAEMKFIYHPQVSVAMQVAKGSHPPQAFPSSCSGTYTTGDSPFDIVLDGMSEVHINFYPYQEYVNMDGIHFTCDQLNDNFVIHVESDLGVDSDTCSANNGGCTKTIEYKEYQGFNRSVANVVIISGEQNSFTNPYDNRDQNEYVVRNVDEYVGSNVIRYTVTNKKYYLPQNGYLAGKGDSKVLLLGVKAITEDTLVAVLHEQNELTPLLYLYAPPAGPPGNFRQVQTVNMDFSAKLSSSIVRKTDQRSNLYVAGGVRIRQESDYNNIELDIGGSSSTSDISRKVWDDNVTTSVISRGMTLSTPFGQNGKYGDMVLIFGSVTKIKTAVSIEFNETSCLIDEIPSVVWGQENESLLFLSKADCEREMKKLEFSRNINLMKLKDNSTTASEKSEAQYIIDKAYSGITTWFKLLSHWDNDKLLAKHHPVDVRGYAAHNQNHPERVNSLTLGSSSFTLSMTNTSSFSHIANFSSNFYSKEGALIFSNHILGGYRNRLAGFGFMMGPFVDLNSASAKMVTKVDEDIQTQTKSKTVSVTFVDGNPGDTTCVNVFKSPWSGTFVFEVCGGATMCPHVDGTDARQKIKLYTIETPNQSLLSNKGRVVLELDTMDTIDTDIKYLDIVLELDASTVLSPVSFNVGSASLNQPLEFSLPAREKTQVSIFFERLDPSLKSINIVGNVRAKCDSKIKVSFGFHVSWQSRCPAVTWGGMLVDSMSYFSITSGSPDLPVTAINPTGRPWREYDDISISVDLYFREHSDPNAGWKPVLREYLLPRRSEDTSDWEFNDLVITSFVDKEDDFGKATLWLNGENNNLFVDGQLYEFELHSVCLQIEENGNAVEVGRMKSGIRIGIVDMEGPEVMSFIYPNELAQPMKSFPLISILFNEAVDCLHPMLRATVTMYEGNITFTKVAKTYCSGLSQQLNVIVRVDLEEVNALSSGNARVDVYGIHDLFGNKLGETGKETIDKIRFLQSTDNQTMNEVKLTLNMSMPLIPNFDGSESEWFTPSEQELVSNQEEVFKRLIPLDEIKSHDNRLVEEVREKKQKMHKGTVVGLSISMGAVGVALIAFFTMHIVKRNRVG